MLEFLSLCLPIFAVVFIGLGAARAEWVTPIAVDTIGLFAFNVALPAMLFRLMGSQPLSESFQPDFFVGYLGACLLLFGAVTLIAKARPYERQRAAALGAAAAMGNVGYLAPPLLLPILGPRVAGPVAMAIIAEVAVIIAIGSLLMTRSTVPGAGLATAWVSVKSVARNPVILSVAGGALFAATSLAIPASIDRFLSFLGGAAGPTALFALGGTLGRHSVRRDLVVVASGVTFAKLVAYPVLIFVTLDWLLGLERFWVLAGVLLAAMPTATNAFVLAQRNGAGVEEVSATVMLSTLLAALAFPATAWLLSAPVALR